MTYRCRAGPAPVTSTDDHDAYPEIWLVVATAWLPARQHRVWLAGQALTALAVNHLLFSNW
ncbi:MAG: hypothetical protein AUG44_06645 [Actinobacteria bacterium 13_1_20CM_3_71_11]|nr:MAG: hypothetical protein AUG44_06645 [Actinobacteria bacterium 13_1_20CM_3_71_11]